MNCDRDSLEHLEEEDTDYTLPTPLPLPLSPSSPTSRHICYIIFDRFGSTYNGYTVDMERRIRQHNREIKGGAKFTTRKQMLTSDPHHWRILLTVTVDDESFDNHRALSLEWSIKNPTNRRTRPKRTPHARIESLKDVFSNPKFGGFHFDVNIYENSFFPHAFTKLSHLSNISIRDISASTSPSKETILNESLP